MATISVSPGGAVDFQPVVSGSTPIVFSLSGQPSWVTINASSGRVTGTVPTSQPAGSVSFEIVARNCYSNGQAGNEARYPITLNVTLACAPVAIVDSGTGTCVPTDIVTPTLINTIVKGQVVTSFTFTVTGDESAAMPKIVWTTLAEAVLSKVPNTVADYRLVVATGDLPDGTYDFPVYAANCSSPTNNSARTFRIIVGTGVAGSPSTGGGTTGSGCAVAISVAGSHPVDQILNYQLTISGGSTCSVWQTWLLRADGTGGTGGDGAVIGQIDSASSSPGNYTKDVSNLPPGDYLLWGKCNDAGACLDSWVMRPITLTAPGTQPSSGGGCTKPALLPGTYTTSTLAPDGLIALLVTTTPASPVQGVSVKVTNIGGTGKAPTIRPVAGSPHNFSVLVGGPADAVPGTSWQFSVAVTNQCGDSEAQVYTINYVAKPEPPAGCIPASATQPPDSIVTDVVATATTTFTVSGNGTVEVFAPTTLGVQFSRTGNSVVATAKVLGTEDTQIPLLIANTCGSVMRVWTIRGQATAPVL